MKVDSTRKAIDAVEWLAGFWELTEPAESRSANPDLLALLGATLNDHPAFAETARRRRERSRDSVVKTVVRSCYGEATGDADYGALLSRIPGVIAGLFGSERHDTIQQARSEAQARVEELCGPWDPAGDLAIITGERVPLRVVAAASVFLPPPPAGRHGVLVARPDGSSIAHLHFGFPLRRDPRQFSVNHGWLLGGAWHYAIQMYLDRDWPAIARQLASYEEVGCGVRTVAPAKATDARPWTDLVAAHLNVAIKCVLSHRLGLGDGVHRLNGHLQGCALAPWLEAWIEDGVEKGGDFAAYLRTLPQALADRQSEWEPAAMAEARSPLNSNLNFALASPEARRGTLVVPDGWTDDEAAKAVSGWSSLRLPMRRYRDWIETGNPDGEPVIAIGEPERNPLVKQVLEQRKLNILTLGLTVPTIVALSLPDFAGAEWCVAVAVTCPESAEAIRLETLLKRTRPYLLFESGVAMSGPQAQRAVGAEAGTL